MSLALVVEDVAMDRTAIHTWTLDVCCRKFGLRPSLGHQSRCSSPTRLVPVTTHKGLLYIINYYKLMELLSTCAVKQRKRANTIKYSYTPAFMPILATPWVQKTWRFRNWSDLLQDYKKLVRLAWCNWLLRLRSNLDASVKTWTTTDDTWHVCQLHHHHEEVDRSREPVNWSQSS